MSFPQTPDAIRTIRRNAGMVPADRIARDLGWPYGRLLRAARTFNIDLRMRVADPASEASRARGSAADIRSEQFGARFRTVDADILRAKAADHFMKPATFIAAVIEGAILRGKLDDLASAGKGYRPVAEASGDEAPE